MIRLFFALALLLSTTPMLAGVTCRFQVTTAGGMAPGMSGRVAIEGTKLRIALADTVMISTDGGSTITLLHPAAKTYSTMAAGDLAGAGIKITGMRSSTKDLGDGGKVEGYPTRRARSDVSFNLEMEMLGTTHVEMQTESWSTDRLPAEMANVFHLMGGRTGDPALDKALAGVGSQQKGIPLKEVMTMTMSINGGSPTTITTTSTITDIQQRPIPASEFVIPAGYRKTAR